MKSIQDFVRYAPATTRPPVRWPGGKRLAFWIVPNVEFYEYTPPPAKGRETWDRVPSHPDVREYGFRDYGNRVGVFRLMELFDRYRLPCTVSLSMAVLQMYPEVTEGMLSRHWELMSHGLYNTRYHWNLSEDEERASIEECQEIHRRIAERINQRRGWRRNFLARSRSRWMEVSRS